MRVLLLDEGDFADRIEHVYIGVCGKIGQHAAASEMCGRHDWNRLIADVESERQAVRVNTRKVVLDEVRRLVRDVEIHMTQTQAFHLEVDRTGDDVARREFRSEEHTSELQSLMRITYAVFCLKNKNLEHTTQKT